MTSNDVTTSATIDSSHVPPSVMTALLGVESLVRQGRLEHSLVHLVKLVASYRNGCAYCVDMHTKEARARGETEQRLYATPVWREAPFFTPRERAALAFTEALTGLGGGTGVPEPVFAQARRSFSEAELVDLTVAVIAINMWNRMRAVVHAPAVGTYRPAARTPSEAAVAPDAPT